MWISLFGVVTGLAHDDNAATAYPLMKSDAATVRRVGSKLPSGVSRRMAFPLC